MCDPMADNTEATLEDSDKESIIERFEFFVFINKEFS